MMKNNIAAARKKTGLTRNAVAKKIKTSASNVRYIEGSRLTGKIWAYISFLIKQGASLDEIIYEKRREK
ncbi:MAG: helix-turn-helix domain-containing protein [Tannerella sp.]|jgi:DNA-binding XRE family transcriptional regulator|nr:helix-turn-helix domain-containing protein [Tannerella sp.]